MNINLKTIAANGQAQQVQVNITQRLPANIEGPCVVDCEYQVRREDNYYLLTLAINAQLTLICQRCLNQFPCHYTNNIVLAICETDDQAARLMNQYDCITARNNEVDLVELLTDELYLYAPVSHPDLKDCDTDVSEFIITNKTG
jgi:uncharacterized protein